MLLFCDIAMFESVDAFASLSPSYLMWTDAGDTPVRPAWVPTVGLQQGSAFASIVSVYRNGMWQRIPKLLLAEVCLLR